MRPVYHIPSHLARALCLPALALALALFASGPGIAEPAFSFEATPGRLPKSVVPIHYAIALEPNLDSLRVAGSQVVQIEVREPTARLVLHAVNMDIEHAAIDGGAERAQIALDATAETATLTFPQSIAAGRHTLRIAFKSHINRFSRGIYYVDYPTERGSKRMIATKLQPADARRIFPCWDEPAFKASFELAVTVPQAFTAVGNMPVTREEAAGPGAKRVSFAPTPRMSSYLVVLAAGEFERLTEEADGVTVSVVTTPGKREQSRFALESAIRLLHYFNDYFGVKYPLPKLDLIAIPGGFSGAMENWGGITFRENLLLFDPATSGPAARRRIFSLIAHEIAHQWFGDLVTMGWWDNIWLNEGFATWMQTKAAEHFFPQWQSWLNGSDGKQGAMNVDARRTSHPIRHPVTHESEASFDSISYSKGQALIRMLEDYLGEDMFRAGIRRYMRDHAFGNTTTADLWRALETASGQPIASIGAAYTEQAGLPLVLAEAVCRDGEQRVVLRQERFTLRDPDAAPHRWQVPIAYGPLQTLPPARLLLVPGETREIAAGRCGDPIKVNRGDVGYYRVQYDATLLAALAKSLPEMAPADRVNLLADTWALVEAGRSPVASFFELVEAIGSDNNGAVWDQVMRGFNRIDFIARGQPGRAAFHAYARARTRAAFERARQRVEERSEEADTLYTRLFRFMGAFGDPAVVKETKRRFAEFRQHPFSLRVGMLGAAVIDLAGRHADHETYVALLGLARSTTNTSERSRYLFAAAGARDPALARETLARTLTDEFPADLISGVIRSVASSGEHPDLAWDFVRTNFAALEAKQGPLFRRNFVSNLLTNFTDLARVEELAKFAPAHETSGGRIVAARSAETIRASVELRERLLPAVDEWVGRHSVQ